MVYLHENHKNHPNVGKYTMTMDPMGINNKGVVFKYCFCFTTTVENGPI